MSYKIGEFSLLYEVNIEKEKAFRQRRSSKLSENIALCMLLA